MCFDFPAEHPAKSSGNDRKVPYPYCANQYLLRAFAIETIPQSAAPCLLCSKSNPTNCVARIAADGPQTELAFSLKARQISTYLPQPSFPWNRRAFVNYFALTHFGLKRHRAGPYPSLRAHRTRLRLGSHVAARADQVVERMRHACLDGVRLVSNRQPTRFRVDEHTAEFPQIWLHPDGGSMAWIVVDIGERD